MVRSSPEPIKRRVPSCGRKYGNLVGREGPQLDGPRKAQKGAPGKRGLALRTLQFKN